MPSYDFENEDTGEIVSLIMSVKELDDYKKNNPQMKQKIFSAPKMVRGTLHPGDNKDEGWKENLARIAEAHPNSALAERQGGKSSKDAKVAQAAKKHGYGKTGNYKIDF